MDKIKAFFVQGWGGGLNISPLDLTLAIACDAGCSFVVSETYRRTHRGADYSRSFLQVLILVSVIVAFVTLIVGNDLARAFTLVGALSVVRFRTAVKDARDLAFIFWCVALGMGAGVQLIAITITATIALSIIVFFMSGTGYGMRDPDLKVLRVRVLSNVDYTSIFHSCFSEFLISQKRVSVALVRQGMEYELIYSVRLRESVEETRFIDAIREINGNLSVTVSDRDQETLF